MALGKPKPLDIKEDRTPIQKKRDGDGTSIELSVTERYNRLLAGVAPFLNAIRTLDEDVRELDKVRDPTSYGGHSFGKPFACFRARSRLAYSDFEVFNKAAKELGLIGSGGKDNE